MAPEVAMGKSYDSKADVWAIGVILYELVTLRKPFESESIRGVLDQIVKCDYPSLPGDTDPKIRFIIQ